LLATAADEKNQTEVRERTFRFLTAVAPFCREGRVTASVLTDLMFSGEKRSYNGKIERTSLFQVQRQKYEQIREALGDAAEKAKGDALLLPLLDTAAQKLIDVRDSLAEALRALKKPSNFPSRELNAMLAPPEPATQYHKANFRADGKSIAKLFQENRSYTRWGRSLPLDLTNCFLCGANLTGAQLQGANFRDARLQGVNFLGAELQGATLRSAKMGNAKFYRANFQGADFLDADLRGANLGSSFLEGSNLHGVFVQERPTEEGEATLFPVSTLETSIFEPNNPFVTSPNADARTTRLKEWLAEQRDQRAAIKQSATPPREDRPTTARTRTHKARTDPTTE
jgi:uncharacterized protein YjbI with pentapeptide repeats